MNVATQFSLFPFFSFFEKSIQIHWGKHIFKAKNISNVYLFLKRKRDALLQRDTAFKYLCLIQIIFRNYIKIERHICWENTIEKTCLIHIYMNSYSYFLIKKYNTPKHQINTERRNSFMGEHMPKRDRPEKDWCTHLFFTHALRSPKAFPGIFFFWFLKLLNKMQASPPLFHFIFN